MPEPAGPTPTSRAPHPAPRSFSRATEHLEHRLLPGAQRDRLRRRPSEVQHTERMRPTDTQLTLRFLSRSPVTRLSLRIKQLLLCLGSLRYGPLTLGTFCFLPWSLCIAGSSSFLPVPFAATQLKCCMFKFTLFYSGPRKHSPIFFNCGKIY